MGKIVILILLSISIYADSLSYKVVQLMNYAEENPKDIKSRELLLKYFYKNRDRKLFVKYSKELFLLSPKNKVLRKIVSKYIKIEKEEKIVSTLNNLFANKEYIRYLNLYISLIDLQKKIDSDFHLKAIYSAIEIDDFDLAQKIFQREKLPITPMFGKVMAKLDKKLNSDKNL